MLHMHKMIMTALLEYLTILLVYLASTYMMSPALTFLELFRPDYQKVTPFNSINDSPGHLIILKLYL